MAKRAITVDDVLKKQFNELPFEGMWHEACGLPEHGGQTWMIWGGSKMGKTTFAMAFGKMLTRFGKVAYDSIEEGFCKSVRTAYKRAGMKDVKGKFLLLDKEELPELMERLRKRNPPQFIFIDSVQFAEMTFAQYKQLKLLTAPGASSKKGLNIIYISHIEGRLPEGSVAKRILKDASMSFFIEGFKAIPTSRYHDETSTGDPIIINQEKADKYWGLKNI